MDSKNIIQNVLSLSPAERLFIIETLSNSLSEPDKDIEKYWKEEVEKRYEAFINGKVKSIRRNLQEMKINLVRQTTIKRSLI